MLLLSGLLGTGLVWFVGSVETYTYFTAQPPGSLGPLHRDYGSTALSVFWAVYAAVLLIFGFVLRNKFLRWEALALFGVTLAKVVLIDMAALPGLYRVLAFLVLAVMMGFGAWAYQKFQKLWLIGQKEES